VLPAGRRSGKTELAKRKLVMRAIRGSSFRSPRYFAAAPTRDQAKTIYWADLQALCPPDLIADVGDTELSIKLTTGAEIRVVGMDRPQRIEGAPWDGGVLDEFGNMKPGAWGENVRPALSDRHGWCDLIGVPEGRNHYFDMDQAAQTAMATLGAASEWGAFTWTSATVLPAGEIAGARADLDERTFRQEYEASFESYSGVVLYAFTRAGNVRPCPYDPALAVHIGMDFNVNPMTATVWQERAEPVQKIGQAPAVISHQVGEIIIATSNTDEMADEIVRRYALGGSVGHISVYPDPAGAAGHTSAQGRTDISILRARGFMVHAMASHPLVRDRLAVTNARFCNAVGERRQFVDPACVKSIRAYERLVYKEDTNDPDKSGGFDHAVDATGYYDYVRFATVPPRMAQIVHMGR
jgi:hypothetical protein